MYAMFIEYWQDVLMFNITVYRPVAKHCKLTPATFTHATCFLCGLWGEWRYSSTIFHLSPGWKWMVSIRPLKVYVQGESPRYPFKRRLCGPQNRSWRSGEEKYLSLARNRTRQSKILVIWSKDGTHVPKHVVTDRKQTWYDKQYLLLQGI
jgi:hypothetical protein